MTDLSSEIRNLQVRTGELAVFWLGEAGFVFKDADGNSLGVDLYLSDCVSRYDGFKRLMPFLAEVQDLKLDTVAATHFHLDHFDVDAMPFLVQNGARVVAAEDCRELCDNLSIKNADFLKPGDCMEGKGFTLEAVPCDHGTLAPDAIGLLITAGNGKRIYFTGDTSFREDYFSESRLKGVDLLILPINGQFGNMNEEEAAEAVALLKPKYVVPCHYWNFAEHGGDPGKFIEAMKKYAPDILYNIMRMGECIAI